MLVKDNETINECRYSENIPEKYKRYILLADKSEPGPAEGIVKFLAVNKACDDFILLEYTFGSCSGCDDWERRDLSGKQIEQEIEQCILHLTLDEFNKFRSHL